MTTLLQLVAVVAVALAVLGRHAMPRAERVPLHRWRCQDLLANIAGGCRELARLHRLYQSWEEEHGPIGRSL